MHHKPVRRTRRSRGISRPTIAATDRIDLTDRISGRKIAATDRNGGVRLSLKPPYCRGVSSGQQSNFAS